MKDKVKKKTTETKSDKIILSKIIEKLFGLLGIDTAFEVREEKKQDALMVDVQTDEGAGLLIGNRGRNLNAIQTISGIIFKNKTGDWKRIIIDVGNWREKEETRLKELAIKTAERVKETGDPQPVYNLSPAQRRLVHMALSEEEGIKTESVGEDEERYLVVSLE
jgi:spoIIIJ-associated protein